MSVAGRVIVVTGAASGIGRATADLLRERGATVIGIDRDTPADGPALLRADLSLPSAIDGVIDKLPEHIDGLCAIAGVPGTAGYEAVRDINYLGVRHLVNGLVGRMPAGGSVASATSVAGGGWRPHRDNHLSLAAAASFDEGLSWCAQNPIDRAKSYSFFKEALVVWTMQQVPRLTGLGLRINCVSPGPVDTPILDDFRQSLGTEKVQSDIDRVGRAGRAADIAPIFAFLMSTDSAWMTGVDVACDGGLAAIINTANAAVDSLV